MDVRGAQRKMNLKVLAEPEDLWVAIKHTNVLIMESEKRGERAEKYLKKQMAKNFPKLIKDMNLHIQEFQ